VKCETSSLELSPKTNKYKTYVHKCRTDQINYEEIFHYMAYGWAGSSSDPVPYKDFISAKLADPLNVPLNSLRKIDR
jgi:hypothetical protein